MDKVHHLLGDIAIGASSFGHASGCYDQWSCFVVTVFYDEEDDTFSRIGGITYRLSALHSTPLNLV